MIPQLVVDAWLTNEVEAQVITLTMSQPYFQNTFPEGISGATVQVIRDDGEIFEFQEAENGQYIWLPEGIGLGEIGNEFGLAIELDGKTYGSLTTLNRVAPIDSIRTEFRDDEFGFPDGIYAEVFARDLEGPGDMYWIKTFKNGEFLNKPLEINYAYDAGFSPGANVDGLIFIPPIREGVNRVADSDGDDDNDVAPWDIGDEIHVEIHSLSLPAFNFLATAERQMINGLNGIFSEPVINTPGNVVNINDENEEVLGIFNVAAVSAMTKVID